MRGGHHGRRGGKAADIDPIEIRLKRGLGGKTVIRRLKASGGGEAAVDAAKAIKQAQGPRCRGA